MPIIINAIKNNGVHVKVTAAAAAQIRPAKAVRMSVTPHLVKDTTKAMVPATPTQHRYQYR